MYSTSYIIPHHHVGHYVAPEICSEIYSLMMMTIIALQLSLDATFLREEAKGLKSCRLTHKFSKGSVSTEAEQSSAQGFCQKRKTRVTGTAFMVSNNNNMCIRKYYVRSRRRGGGTHGRVSCLSRYVNVLESGCEKTHNSPGVSH